MAKYDYRCKDCGEIQEVRHGMNEKPEIICTACGGSHTSKYMGRYTAPVVNYKGGDWAGKTSSFDRLGVPEGVRKSAIESGF